MISIFELSSLTKLQISDILALMEELDPEIDVSPEMIEAVVQAEGSHLFVAAEGDAKSGLEHIVGCATLCVYESPTGRKASVEDVVVSSAYRGQHIERKLMEHVISFARKNLVNVDLCLTSRPHRVAANNLYNSLGFRRKETNVYKMSIGQ